MSRPRISYGDKVEHGAGWTRVVTLDDTVTVAVELVQGRPKESEHGWGHDWHGTVLDVGGRIIYQGRVKKQTGVRTILERAGLMGSELAQGRDCGRGAIVVQSEDDPPKFAIVNPQTGECYLRTTSESLAHQECSVLEWSRLANEGEAEQAEAERAAGIDSTQGDAK